jgi:hypothetical protein
LGRRGEVSGRSRLQYRANDHDDRETAYLVEADMAAQIAAYEARANL